MPAWGSLCQDTKSSEGEANIKSTDICLGKQYSEITSKDKEYSIVMVVDNSLSRMIRQFERSERAT